MLTPQSYYNRLGSLGDDQDFALRRRASYLVIAKRLVTESPILGSGPDTFSYRYAETETGRRFKRKWETGRRDAHNTYIEVIVGSGVIGLALFLAILLFALRSMSSAIRQFTAKGRNDLALLSVAYRMAMISLLIYLLIFSDVYHKYLLLALAASQIARFLAQQLPDPEDSNA
jgi:O-antigen ligase